MAAAMRDGHDVIRAVHFTFLTEDGEKADVPKPKLIWPNFKGAVIRLSKGAAGRSVIQATEAGEPETVVVTEGIEDALTVALVSVLRCWAAGSIANIGNAPVLPFIEAWVIHRQNDVSPAAIEAFDRAKRALENTGRLVGELRAHGGKDINDQLRGRPATTLK
jgi:hypothetical protein